MSSVSDEAFEAAMVAIKEQAEQVGKAPLHVTGKAAALRDLAAAYRHLSGGAQPGSVHVEK